MARIIRFDRDGQDGHDEVQLLLPWYVNGRLDGVELALVERHLRDCAECRAEAAGARRMMRAVAELPLDADASWAELRRRITAPSPLARLKRRIAMAWARRPVLGGGEVRAQAAGGGVWSLDWGWALAAQALVASAAIGLVLSSPRAPRPEYHTLGAPPPVANGDAIVVFRPDARADEMTQALRLSGVRLVDGPTSTDAYLVRTPAQHGDAALGRLRAQRVVALAEPLDPGGAR